MEGWSWKHILYTDRESQPRRDGILSKVDKGASLAINPVNKQKIPNEANFSQYTAQ